MRPNLHYVLWLSFLLNTIVFAQQKKLDSLLAITSKISDSLNIDIATNLIYEITQDEKFNIALFYSDKFIDASKIINYNLGAGRLYIEKANIFNLTDRSIKAMKSYDLAESYFLAAKYDKGIAVINNNKSIIEHRLGNLERSIAHLLKAQIYYKKLNDSISLADTFNNLGNVYNTLKQSNLAKKYYKKSISIKRKYQLKNLGSTLNNLAFIYINSKEIDSAITILNEALIANKKQNSSRNMAGSYSALGRIYLDKKNYRKAKEYYEASMYVGGKVEYTRRLITTKHVLASIAIKTGSLDEAEEFLIDARAKCRELNSITQLLTNYKHAAQLDSARGNFLSAFEWQKKRHKLLKEESKEEKRKNVKITEQKLKREQEQQRLLDKQLLNEQIAKEKLFRQKIFTYIAISAFMIALIFIFFIIKSRLERAKYIEKLDRSNQVKNKLFSIISHDLKNEIHGLDNTLNLLRDNLISEKEFKEFLPLLSNSTHQTSILLTNLLNWSKSQMNKLKAYPEPIDFYQIIQKKLILFQSKASLKGITLINNLMEGTKIYADIDMITIVTQNLIANAIKFCNPGDTVTIYEQEKEQVIKIYFQDTGIGISKENLVKLFSEETYTTTGTDNESGTGLGLKICKELITLNDGKINVTSTIGQGSTFCIALPKAP